MPWLSMEAFWPNSIPQLGFVARQVQRSCKCGQDRLQQYCHVDVVWFPPGLKHWHGATPTTAMTHIAVQESLDGSNVDWLEKVGDAQYRK